MAMTIAQKEEEEEVLVELGLSALWEEMRMFYLLTVLSMEKEKSTMVDLNWCEIKYSCWVGTLSTYVYPRWWSKRPAPDLLSQSAERERVGLFRHPN